MLARAWGFLGLISATLIMTGFYLTLRHGGWHPGAATGPGSPLNHVYRQATTVAWLGIVTCQIGTAFAVRTDHASLRSIGVFSNRFLLGAIGIALAFAAALIYIPALNSIFGTAAAHPGPARHRRPLPLHRLGRRRTPPPVPAPPQRGPAPAGLAGRPAPDGIAPAGHPAPRRRGSIRRVRDGGTTWRAGSADGYATGPRAAWGRAVTGGSAPGWERRCVTGEWSCSGRCAVMMRWVLVRCGAAWMPGTGAGLLTWLMLGLTARVTRPSRGLVTRRGSLRPLSPSGLGG